MPYGNYKRSAYKKRAKRPYTRSYGSKYKYSKKRGAYKMKVKRGTTAVNFTGIGLPKTVISKLKFNYTGVASPAANVPVYINFGMNDPYAPPGTSVDQPTYFDQLCTANLYTKFTCYKATYRVRFWNQSAGTEAAQYLVWYGDSADTATIIARATTNALMYEEREQSTAYGYTLTEPGSTQATRQHKGVVTPFSTFGKNKNQIYSEEQFSGAYNAGPTRRANLMIGFAGDPTTTLAAVIRYEISIVYHVKFYDLANNVVPT